MCQGKYCPICGGKGLFSGTNKPCWPVLQCRACGFSYLDVPDDEIAAANQIGMDVRAKWERLQGNYAVAHFTWLLKRLRPSTLLDIGCGNGLLMRCAAELGIQAEGMDVSPWAASDSFTVYRDWQSMPPKHYDLVTCTRVLEHIPRPLDFVRRMRDKLADGGRICITVPNYGGAEAWGRPDRLLPQSKPVLCNFFRARDFRTMGVQLGLSCHVRPYGIPHLWASWKCLDHSVKDRKPTCRHWLSVPLYYWLGRLAGSKLEVIYRR